MGKALADRFPVARRTFEEADTAFAAVDGQVFDGSSAGERGQARLLSTLCFEGPENDLALTEITQPAILTASIAAYRVLAAEGITPAYVAGHSLGEYSAHVAAGTFAFAEAVALVRRRGRYMQDAVPIGTGAMAAILGGDLAAVRQACDDAAQGEIVSPANINCSGSGRDCRSHCGGPACIGTREATRRAPCEGAVGQRALPLRVDEAGRGAPRPGAPRLDDGESDGAGGGERGC